MVSQAEPVPKQVSSTPPSISTGGTNNSSQEISVKTEEKKMESENADNHQSNTGANTDTTPKEEVIPPKEIEQPKPVSKLDSMSIDTKKKIYAEYIQAQRLSGEETLKLYPTKKQAEDFKAYIAFDTANREKHYQEVAKKNGLTRDELDKIMFQGNLEMWEMPERNK